MLLGLAWLSACGGGGGGNPQPGPVRYTLTGSVVDGSGLPIAGAQVLLGLTEKITDAAGVFSYANLQAGTYTISIQDDTGRFDCREVSLSAASTQFSFSLPATGGGFRVVRVFPALNSTGVGLDSGIVIETTDAPDLDSLEGAIQTTPDIGEFELAYDAPEVTIRPRLQLPLGQTVVVELDGGFISDGGGALAHPVRWLFRTAASDTSPPRLLSVTPSGSQANSHPPNLGVSLEFNETIAIDDPAFSVSSIPEAELTARAIGNVLAVNASGGWQTQTQYTVMAAGVADETGNASPGAFTLEFTTGQQPAHSDDIQPHWNEVLDLIVFSSSQNGGYDIFSIRPDGSELSQLTNLPGDEFFPTLSADGSLLAFQHRSGSGKWDVYVMDREGGTPEAITTEDFNDTQPTFTNTQSNDIVFVSDRVNPAGLYSMHFDGSNPAELDHEFNSSQARPDVHPLLDNQLLFVSGRGGSLDIWRKTVSAIDGSAINLNLTADTVSDEFSPSWNADAGSFVYVSNDGGTDSLWTSDAAGEFPRKVTAFDVDLDYPEMSPFAGSLECLVSLDGGPGGASLVLLEIAGGEILRHLTGPEALD